MPSETMDLKSLSSSPSYSFFSDDKRFPTEIGFWKSDIVLDQRVCKKPVTSSTMEKIIPVESQITRYVEHTGPFTKQNQKVNLFLDSLAVGAERVPNQSPKLLRPLNQGPGTNLSFNGEYGFHFSEENKVSTMTSQYENSLFSSSFSELFTRELRLSSNNALYGRSIDTVASHYEEEEPFKSLEELEARTIGNLLPNVDDLFSEVTEGHDIIVKPNGLEEAEDLDVFSAVGGMDLGDDDSTVLRKNSKFLGESYLGLYNTDNGTTSGVNSAKQAPILESTIHHGISSSVSNSLTSMVRVGSIGNQSVIAESAHLQGQVKSDVQRASSFHSRSLPEYQNGLSGGVHLNSLGPMAANINSKPLEIIDNRPLSRIISNGHSFEFNKAGFPSIGNGSHLLPADHYSWSNSYHPWPPSIMWPRPPSLVNGICSAHPTAPGHGHPRLPSQMLDTGAPINSHHVGSATTVNHSLWDRRHAYAGESLEASTFHPGSLGSLRGSNNLPCSMEFVSQNFFPHVAGNCVDLSMSQKNVQLQSLHPRSSMNNGRRQIVPIVNSGDSPHERTRSRRNEGSINHAEKKQYELDIDHIIRGEDKRTTLMLKNIPNKYTSKMLMAAIDERHRGTYDFMYLPIDFKNKCNVGYAFINMVDPSQIISFYQTFNGKKWEKFNSEKVASLAYARIQGKAALIAHFQNSSLMNEDKRCRPILFNTDGPNAGDQVPFPMGVNIRTRPGKACFTSRHEENNQERLPNFENDENSSNGETCSSNESG